MIKFIMAGPYILSQKIVMKFKKHAWLAVLLAYLLALAWWTLQYRQFQSDAENKGFFIAYVIHKQAVEGLVWFMNLYQLSKEQGLGIWHGLGWLLQTGVFLWDVWIHYALFCFFMAILLFEDKASRLLKLKNEIDSDPHPEVLGIDLIKSKKILMENLVEWSHLEVAGGAALPDLLQRFLYADAQRGCSIIILAPPGMRELLNQITKVLSDVPVKERRTFFYHSVQNKDLSTSYSPFYKPNPEVLRCFLRLSKQSKEYEMLNLLIETLESKGKPYEFRDLELLLSSQGAVAALKDHVFNQKYLWSFNANRTVRDSLRIALMRFHDEHRLGHYRLTDGFPLDMKGLLPAHKHLYLDVDFSKPITNYLLGHLYQELMDYNYRFQKTYFYVLYPEILNHDWLKDYLKEVEHVVHFRIFSSELYYRHTTFEGWSTILLPEFYSTRKIASAAKYFTDELNREIKNLRQNSSFDCLTNYESWGAMKNLRDPFKDRLAMGGFFRCWSNGYQELRIKIFYVPSQGLGCMKYEPSQQTIKPQDMLGLENIVPKIKFKMPTYDPGVADIVNDLKKRSDTAHG